ncbi:MAG TPA: metallophosphoesterase, partial [Acidimicrobiales bacterium]|nr:metallophosphoesterase [Acidimicrobiales bacterium]
MALLGPVVGPPGRGPEGPSLTVEVTTVADDEAVLHDGATVLRHTGLTPDTDYERDGASFRTLQRPVGERLAVIATVNDVHFGEVEAGIIEGTDLGPTFRSAPGEPPYPETMNAGAIVEIAAISPDAVVAKGDLTSSGLQEEYQAFLDAYGAAFGDRLHHVRGNHDAKALEHAAWPTQEVTL